MRSMTGYGRGESSRNGGKFTVELNSVNRKQNDVLVSLPRELVELEPRVRDLINTEVSRGRLTVVVAHHAGNGSAQLALDPLAIGEGPLEAFGRGLVHGSAYLPSSTW